MTSTAALHWLYHSLNLISNLIQVIAQGTEAKAGTVEETAGVDSTAECSNAIAELVFVRMLLLK